MHAELILASQSQTSVDFINEILVKQHKSRIVHMLDALTENLRVYQVGGLVVDAQAKSAQTLMKRIRDIPELEFVYVGQSKEKQKIIREKNEIVVRLVQEYEEHISNLLTNGTLYVPEEEEEEQEG